MLRNLDVRIISWNIMWIMPADLLNTIPKSGNDFEIIFGSRWAFFVSFWEIILGRFWGSFWDNFWIMLERCWDHIGIISGSFWNDFGIMLGSFLDHFGTIVGSFWDHFWIILGQCGYYFGIISGSFWEDLQQYSDIWFGTVQKDNNLGTEQKIDNYLFSCTVFVSL